jgi:alkylation response protein AidB-like acyl-CoA dehydrogenase
VSQSTIDRPIPGLSPTPPNLLAMPRAAAKQNESKTDAGTPSIAPPMGLEQRIEQLMASAISLADDIASRPNTGGNSLPHEDLRRLAELGLLSAPVPERLGGLGLGCTPGSHHALLQLLSIVGGADLVLGRLYEGHVNAIILISAYGTPSQVARAAKDCIAGRWFGVWNTGGAEPLRLRPGPPNGHRNFVFQGGKTFASGAGFVQRPIVTAQMEDESWRMTLPRMESPEVSRAFTIDRSFWHPMGMVGSESFAVDLTGATIQEDDLIGGAGDFQRDPLFFGGAIRFAAVQAGALLRLHRLFTEWLESPARGRPRSQDPYQVARLGEIAIGAQEAVLWVERAGAVACECFSVNASKLQIERMHETADMTRLAIERIANAMLPRIVAGVGAHGLLQPSPFERILRDLTMYLRQPVPDYTLAAVGRASLRKNNLRGQGAGSGFWMASKHDGSLPPSYFQRVYERSGDPWNFETSEYEAGKYGRSLAALPRQRYKSVLEVGCSIGVFTAQLASRADSLLAVDVSEIARDAARKRCASLPGVRILRMQIPQEEPSGLFDLIVVSEVAYYWQPEDLDRAIDMFARHQSAGSHLLLVHYTKPVPDYPLTGDQVHEIWLRRPEWRLLTGELHEGYRLDLLERRP